MPLELLDRVATGERPGVIDHALRIFLSRPGTHSDPLSMVATRRFGNRAKTPWLMSAASVSKIGRSDVSSPYSAVRRNASNSDDSPQSVR